MIKQCFYSLNDNISKLSLVDELFTESLLLGKSTFSWRSYKEYSFSFYSTFFIIYVITVYNVAIIFKIKRLNPSSLVTTCKLDTTRSTSHKLQAPLPKTVSRLPDRYPVQNPHLHLLVTLPYTSQLLLITSVTWTMMLVKLRRGGWTITGESG